jgi:peptidoglycan/xylan/chitin deacetylase (PgdA/CDA1 family)
VLSTPDALFPSEIDASRFAAQLQWLRSWFTIVDLRDAVRQLFEGTLPSRSLAISFDDGYSDNHTVALPLLQRFGVSATFFVTAGFLDGGRMWNDTVIEAIRGCRRNRLDLRSLGLGEYNLGDVAARRAAITNLLPALKYLPPRDRQSRVDAIAAAAATAIPGNLMLTTPQLRELHAAGMAIGAHTVSHPILSSIDLDAARSEIAEGKAALEAKIDAMVPLFAYPNGKPDRDYTDAHVRMVSDLGFEAAVTTAPGAAGRESDRFQLPRFTPWDRREWRYAVRLARNLWISPTLASAP